MEATDNVIESLTDFGEGEKPSSRVVAGCEEFVCLLLSTKDVSAKNAAELLGAKNSKTPTQGIDKLTPTSGAILQHIYRYHLQANIFDRQPIYIRLDELGTKV